MNSFINDGASQMDEARQLGQLFMMGFDGTSVNAQVRILIEKYYVGSILLTAKNLKSAEQTTQLVLELQTLARNAGHDVPLLIAIDQENGGVNSLYDEIYIRQFPSAMGLAATRSKQLARYVARATAQELAACGVNWILGPVMDVLTNAKSQPLGVRSFGDDPQAVSVYAIETLKGYQEGGLATCGKHFPSYGNLEFFGTLTNVPTITESLEHLEQNALIPFRNSISQGIDAMMVGGVALSSSSMNVMHACLSEQVVQELLRTEMSFSGVVVSECLEMEALSRNIGISGGTVMAFNAGCDVILTCRSLSVQEEAINGLKAGLDNGMIDRMRVQESVQRILSMKNRYTSWDKAFSPQGIDGLSRLQPLHTNFSTSAYNKSITVVRDQRGLLPLSKTLRQDQELLLLTPLVKPLPASGTFNHQHDSINSFGMDDGGVSATEAKIMNGERVFREFGRSIARQRSGKVFHASYTANGLRPLHENLLNRAAAVIVVTADASRNLYQHGFTKHVSTLCKIARSIEGHKTEIPCIVIAVSSPFDFATDTSIGTYICTYDFTETALQALVRVIYGEFSPTGVLPGSTHNAPKQTNARQQWLVETFDAERDIIALDALLDKASKGSEKSMNLLHNVNSETFLLFDTKIEESHFVVRNSTTKELLGFCATYFSSLDQVGRIGAIVVDPVRRRHSIGRSLHDRAIRALLQRKEALEFRLGSRWPNVFPGIPVANPQEHKNVRQWFLKLGWDLTQNQSVRSMVIQDLPNWSPPDGLGQSLSNPDIRYDLVHGIEYTDVIMKHVAGNAQPDVQAMYQIALSNKEGCAIIRAKKSGDGSILGTVLLFRNQSKISKHVPGIQRKDVLIGGLTSPIVLSSHQDKTTVVQGLVLLGTRQLKKQGIQTVLVDHVADTPASLQHDIQALGFTVQDLFEEARSMPFDWTMFAPS